MKKYIITLLFCTLFCHLGIAQGLKSVSILGDSYSTFEGYVQPDTNFVWYLKTPPEGRKTDMVSVRNTWWHQFIKENNYRLCVNNSYSFRPAMAYMLDTMIDYYPNVEIYFLLNDGLGEEISESVRTICKHYQIDCIELKGLDKMSGHPSVKGMKQISEQVKAYMNSRHN